MYKNAATYATLVLVALIIIIIIVLVVLVYRKWLLIKNQIRKAKNTIIKLIPKLSHINYTNINFPRKLKQPDIGNNDFDNNTAQFLIKILNSSYNLAGGFESQLPPYVSFVTKIGTNGYLYKLNDNKYIIAYRGTMSGEDIITDIEFSQMPMNGNGIASTNNNPILVHRGFYKLWEAQKEQISSIASVIRNAETIYITGHSLGAASAALTALELSQLVPKSNMFLYLFAPPRTGNDAFTESLNNNVPHNWAIINQCDEVCSLPVSNVGLFGGSWIYDNYKKRYLLDIETGSLLDNHHLITYSAALGDDSQGKVTSHWNRKAIILVSE